MEIIEVAENQVMHLNTNKVAENQVMHLNTNNKNFDKVFSSIIFTVAPVSTTISSCVSFRQTGCLVLLCSFKPNKSKTKIYPYGSGKSIDIIGTFD
jgi:hypothetical protein